MTERKNKRRAAFIESAANYKIKDGDYVADINAKDFPDRGPHGVFRVYRVYGDITRTDRLKAAIGNLLTERGIDRRRIEITI